MPRADTTSLHSAFAAQAARTPDAVALWHRASSITFAELDARADRLAFHLRRNGVHDALVGVHAERSIDYVVAILGVLKAGCAVVPLPPSLPERRIRQMLDVARVAAVVDVDDNPFDASHDARITHLRESASASVDPAPAVVSGCDRPAFVLSSSGSTGRPKLIVRSHASFFHRLRWTWEQHPFESGEICVQKSYMATTHAIYELFEPLLRGVPVHIVPDDEVRDLAAFWAGIVERKASRLLIVPSMLQASLEIPGFAPPALKVLILMGEHLQTRLAGRVLAAFPTPTAIYSIYGSTEASSALVCDVRASYRPGEELPLGVPISSDVRAVVLDENLAPVADGKQGMLYLAGGALFTEYCNDPELTAATRIELGGDVFYRSLDVVRRLSNGNLEFIGRADDTVKVRGFRVDLREVESAILQLPAVRSCVALVSTRPDGAAGATSLIAFVTPRSVAPTEVLRAVRDTLPDYMAPSAVVPLDAFPLTANGKVDRRRLMNELGAGRPHDAATQALESDTERLVADVWSDVVGHRRFDRRSAFFEIGGNSLDAFAVEHKLSMKLSLDPDPLPAGTLYRFPVLKDLASYLDRRRGNAPGIEPEGNTTLVTLKPGRDPALPPLFLISSAGGTLGAYSKLVRTLRGEREVIGVRDPFLWGARDASSGFQAWLTLYIDAMRQRQTRGPYYIVAYSSAGAFGFEIARRLRVMGQEVALLALIDPLAMDRGSKRRFGHWALEARFARPTMARALRVVGQARRVLPRWWLNRAEAGDWSPSQREFERFAIDTRKDRSHLRRLSALMELNSGLPFALSDAELAAAGSEGGEDTLLNRIRAVAPETDFDTIRRLVVQYELQVRSQHRYQLRSYDGELHLFEPEGPFAGLEAVQLRPYVRRLSARHLPVGGDVARSAAVDGALPAQIRTHYLCMRDDVFVAQLARELDALAGAG
jgi:amino acid adenylation domain-containing protein